MKLIKASEVYNNINQEYGISEDIQKQLMNGNAQFIIDLINLTGYSSYTVSTLAIHLCHYFFQKKSYLHYDRFIIATGCLLFAFKMKDYEINQIMKQIIIDYNKLVGQYENSFKILSFEQTNEIREQLCIAESKIIKIVELDCNIKQPMDYLYKITNSITIMQHREDIFYITKIMLVDCYRTFICLSYSGANIAIAAYLLASNYLNYIPFKDFPENIAKQLENIQEMNEEQILKKWIKIIGKELDSDLSLSDIYDCMYQMNQNLYLNFPEELQQQQKPNQFQQQQQQQNLNKNQQNQIIKKENNNQGMEEEQKQNNQIQELKDQKLDQELINNSISQQNI